MFGLTRCSPVQEVFDLQGDMNRILSSFFGLVPFKGLARELFWAPPVDLEETKEEVVVRVEIPGIKKEEIKLHVQGDTLTITGERKQETEVKEKTIHRLEGLYGKFQRVLWLPSEVEGSRASATYEAGVLTVRLPKSEQAKPKEISINVR